jgi:hypothetical protein
MNWGRFPQSEQVSAIDCCSIRVSRSWAGALPGLSATGSPTDRAGDYDRTATRQFGCKSLMDALWDSGAVSHFLPWPTMRLAFPAQDHQ